MPQVVGVSLFGQVNIQNPEFVGNDQKAGVPENFNLLGRPENNNDDALQQQDKPVPWYTTFGVEAFKFGLVIAGSMLFPPLGGIIAGGIGSIIGQSITKGKIDWGNVAIDTALGAVPGASKIFGWLGRKVGLSSAKSVTLEVIKNRRQSIIQGAKSGALNGGLIGFLGGSANSAYDMSKKGDVDWSKAFSEGLGSIPAGIVGGAVMGAGAQALIGKIQLARQKSYHQFDARLKQQNMSIQQLLERSVKPENLVGEGLQAYVYRIPGIKGFLLRVPKGQGGTALCKNELLPVRDVLPGKNIGQPIAAIPTGVVVSHRTAVTVLKQQRGRPIRKIMDRLAGHKDNTEISTELLYAKSLKYLKLMNGLPQKSFNRLAKRIASIERTGYEIDASNSANILLRSANKKFGMVDVSPKISPAQVGHHNSAEGLSMLFLNRLSFRQITDPRAREAMIQLLDKCLLASMKSNLKLFSRERSLFFPQILNNLGLGHKWPLIQQQYLKGTFTSIAVL